MRIRITEPNRRALSLSRDEIALGIEPRVKAAQAAAEHRRMNPFPGRALTARALTGEQAHRSWHIAHLNRTLSAGIVQGLGLAFADEVLALPGTAADAPPPTLDLEAARPIALEAGLAVALSGEDIEVPTQITCDALDLPVAAPQWLFDGVPPPTTIGLDELLPRNVGTRLRELLAAGRPVPRAGIVVAEPVEYDSLIDPTGAAAHSQCERDLEAEAFDDEVRQESTRLVYYAWPEEWLPLPAPDAQWRNRLAYEIFRREVTATESTRMPWWRLGVPVALVAFNAAWAPLFADRGAVARTGGAPRTRMPFVTGRGTRFLWQARIEQLTEHIAEARALGGTTAQLAEALRWLPPAGLLPKDAIDARARTSVVFPPNVRVDAAPVPLEQLDALLEDSASGTPIDLGAADEIRVLVPVPQQFFEPELLLIERADAGGEIARAIARFVDVRADWLRRRQSLREKQRQLVVALDGPRVAAVPAAAEDPQRLEPERFDPLLPAPTGVIHRSALLAGMHQHFLLNAPAALTPADDVLFAFVQLDRENPPRELMLQFFANGNWEHRAFWGEDLIPWGVPGTAGRLSQGALPAAGEWIRLEIRAADFGLARTDITGVAFTLFDGRAAWGPVGIVGQDPWLTEALLSGSSQHGDGEGWEFIGAEDVNSPFEDAFGTVATGGRRVVAEFEAVKKDVGALRFGTRGAQQTLAQAIDLHGLRSAMKLLKASLDKTNDGIDFGFIRVQSDLYRLRQSVLKQSQATRFAVSPALSQIAELDSAAATREQLADFYGEIKRTGAQAGPQAAPSGGSTPVAERASFANLATAVSPGLTASLGETLVRADLTGAIGSAPLAFTAAAFKATDFDQRTNIFEGDAMTGLAEVRNVSIAARMEQPRAVETKNFTLSTRVEVTQRLAQAELDLDEIIVSGVPTGELDPATGQPQRATRKLTEITDFAGALIDPSPDAARADEAHYFLGGVDVADFTIGLLRNFEGLVARYRAALERCQKAVNSIEVNAAALARRLPVVDRELAEARQDVATARALLAEDEERAVSVNARRDALIAEHVQFLAFARPRFGKRLEPLPARALDNAFEPDTVPACFAQHDDAPAEVLQMLRLIRQAPVAWFPHARGLLDLVDRAPQLDRLAQLVRQPFAQFAVGTAAAPLVAASQQLALSHSAVLAAVRSGAQSTALAASAAENRVQLARVASLADLAAIVEHAVLSRRAVQEYERIAQVASCLHARLGEVKPALRMVWAERFSQFDAPANLGDLSLLPRFGEVPAELREDIVELAAWLRGRAARDEPRAQALINDLLRVCLLAASHSPVNEIVTGRVLRPLPLLPGTLVPIRPSLLDKVRLGQAVQFFDAGRVTATAVVADLQADAAQVRVIRAEPNAQATEAMSVRFQTTFA